MAGSDSDQRGREIEEGQVVSGYQSGSDTETDDEDARYYLQPRHDEDKVVSVAAWLSGSAPAVEEVGDSVSASVATVVAAESSKVSDDTMTHVESACSNDPVVNGGSGSSSPRSSVEPGQNGAAAPEQLPVAPTPAPPQQATFIPLMVPAGSQQVHPTSWRRQAPAGRGFSCKECGQSFPTHQGLGGHVAGHKNRRLAAEAAAAAAAGIDPQEHIACRGGARNKKPHACKICGAVYPSGVSLGGHMRKHYSGKPIVPRKRLRLGLPELALAPPLQQHAPLALEAPIAAPPLLPPGSVRIFGVTFMQPANKEEEESIVEEEQ